MDPVTVFTLLAGIAVGSGGGGIVGAIVMLRRFKVEQRVAETQGTVSLREVDVEQFRAMFPGGLGDAVKHWQDQAKTLMVEVNTLREIERNNYDEILMQRTELDRTKAELDKTRRELELAKKRITQLESERNPSGER